jgi:transcriptional regulator with XRE-family HTH domain
MKTFQDRLRETRIDRDLTQAELAAMLGLNQQQYSRYETGTNEMPVRYLAPLCRALRVSADYLLGLPHLPRPK